MQKTIKSILNDKTLINSEVSVCGWIRSRRDSKAGMSFLVINDGSCFAGIQAVVENNLSNYHSEIIKLTKDCSVVVTGKLVESIGKGQNLELQATKIDVIGWVESPETYPISPKRHTMEHLRDHAHLRVRTNIIGAVSRVRHAVARAIHSFMHNNGFYWVNTPIITTNDCEGAGELFRVSALDLLNLPMKSGKVDFTEDFFGTESFLTVSGQLNVECYALSISRAYTFGPTFRAENSNTSRHLAEFWMIEPEMAFADLTDNIEISESMLKFIVHSVMDEHEDDIAFFNQWVDKTCLSRLEKLLNANFEEIDYGKAIELLKNAKQKFEFPVKWGLDLQSEHERYLCEKVVNGPAAIVNYPKTIKPFYMRVNDDDKTVAAMDIIVPGVGEIIGGSQREERLEILDKRIVETGMEIDDYSWYRDLRRYGTVPHAGFGLGFERVVSYITGVGNVRDVIPFPRTPGQANY